MTNNQEQTEDELDAVALAHAKANDDGYRITLEDLLSKLD